MTPVKKNPKNSGKNNSHLTLGSGYQESGGKNEFSIHWELLCDMRQSGELKTDGELFLKDGKIVVGDI
jgi:aminopeptidase